MWCAGSVGGLVQRAVLPPTRLRRPHCRQRAHPEHTEVRHPAGREDIPRPGAERGAGRRLESDLPETGGELVAAAVLPRDGAGQQRGARSADHHRLQRRGQSDPGSPRGETRVSARLHHHRADDDGLPRPRQEHVRTYQTNCHVERVRKYLELIPCITSVHANFINS